MASEYSVEENPLSEDGKFMARMHSTGSAGEDEIIAEIIGSGTLLQRGEIKHVLDKQNSAMIKLALEGKTVTTGIVIISLGISGNFEDEDDEFRQGVHSLDPITIPGRDLRKAVKRDGSVKKREASGRAPHPKALHDTKSHERNGKVTPGGTLRITGRLLNFNPNDPAQGVFFHQNGTVLRATDYTIVDPSLLVIDAPDEMAVGPWEVEVRVLFKGNTTIRSGRLKKPVTVE